MAGRRKVFDELIAVQLVLCFALDFIFQYGICISLLGQP